MFEVITSPEAVISALRKWRKVLKANGREITRIITHPHGADERQIIWVPKLRIWARVDLTGDDYSWCPYGYSEEEPGDRINITIEINPAITGSHRKAGRIIRSSRRFYLAHKGGKGGGRGRQVSIEEFRQRVHGIEVERAIWADGREEELFVFGDMADEVTLERVASYVQQAEQLAREASERSKIHKLLDYVKGEGGSPPQGTETKQLIDARLGQGNFRKKVLMRWDGMCAISGVRAVELIRASHIKPWKICNDRERLNPANGLPLIPNFDTLFDRGLITFTDNGEMLISPSLIATHRAKFGVPARLSRALNDDERAFMHYHRSQVFKKVNDKN